MSVANNENDRIYYDASYYEKGCISLIECKQRKLDIEVFIYLKHKG